MEKGVYDGPVAEVSANIEDVSDDITKQILICEATAPLSGRQAGKSFKVIPQELRFYRKMKLPIPRRSPNKRHIDRLNARNPQTIWQRNCEKCAAEIQTTFAPERPEKVYCEACYLETIY